MLTMRAATLSLALCAVAGGVAACGGSEEGPGARTQSAARRPDPARWLQVDRARRTVRVRLLIGEGQAASGLNIDGSFKGALMFVVPVGWRAELQCANRSSESRYSCVVDRSPGSPEVAQPGLGVLHPRQGVAPGRASTFTFTPVAPATYRVAAVRGDPSNVEPTGMWVVMKVSRGGSPHAVWLR